MQTSLLDPAVHQLYPEGPFVTLRPTNLHDPLELEQVGDVLRASSEHLTGGSSALTPNQLRSYLCSTEINDVHEFVAELEMLEGGTQIVASGSLLLPLKENLSEVYVHVMVHPAMRGRGIGRLLWDYLMDAARRTGRTKMTCFVQDLAGTTIEQSAGCRLATTAGLTKVSQDDHRVLTLPIPEVTLDALAAHSIPHTSRYELRTITGDLPEELLEAWGLMLRQLDIDDPDEDYDAEIPDYTPERIRSGEARIAERGYRRIAVVALDENGEAAGNTFVEVHAGEGTTLATQENTLVMPEHRGHRLGLAMKVLLHRALAEESPNLRAIQTWNSHINDHMGRINEQLGYRKAGVERCYQGPDPRYREGLTAHGRLATG